MTSWKGNIHGDANQLNLFLCLSVRINNARIRIVWIKTDTKFSISCLLDQKQIYQETRTQNFNSWYKTISQHLFLFV
jgi:hypothetical protein